MGSYISSTPGYEFAHCNHIYSGKEVNDALIKTILTKDVRFVQINPDAKIGVNAYKRLNEEVFGVKPQVALRIFGYGRGELNLKILKDLTNVEELQIDGVVSSNEHFFSVMTKLKHLRFSSSDRKNYDFLNLIPDSLKTLSLGPEAKTDFKTEFNQITRFTNLRTLAISGHYKNLDTIIPELTSLTGLFLSNNKIDNVNFVRGLPKLKELSLKSIPVKEVSVLNELRGLRYLGLSKIASLTSLEFLKNLPELKEILFQALNTITVFPKMPADSRLEKINLWWMKNLRDVSGLEKLKSLKEFTCREISGESEPTDFVPVLKNKSVKKVYILFPHMGKRKQMKELASKYGKINK